MNIEKYISEQNYNEAISECIRSNNHYFGLLLSKVVPFTEHISILEDQINKTLKGLKTEGEIITETINHEKSENPPILSEDEDEEKEKTIRVKLLCHWAHSHQIREWWGKMSKGNYRWNNIELVLDNPDFWVVVNAPFPLNEPLDKARTIVFRMEPYMDTKKEMWGEWASPDPKIFFKVCYHETDYNNNEWHLNKTYNELVSDKIEKDSSLNNIISTVLSSKYYDPGHKKRIDFVKFLDTKDLPVHVFGSNRDYQNYKGSLPEYTKDNAMFPYKYVFNCENNSIKNYYSEKLIDAILAECLIFYWGCPNLKDYIDERAFVYLELNDFEEDYQKIKSAIENNLWEDRIEIIRKEKLKIMNHLAFFPRLERIINKNEK